MDNHILKKFFFTVIFAISALHTNPLLAKEALWGPWPDKRADIQNARKARPLARTLFDFYQKHISSDDGAACPFYPTCSAYAYQAVGKHGFLYGGLLALDRLFSEYPGMPNSGLYPLITKFGFHRPFDPVP